MRREILDEVGALLLESFAGGEWGRVRVEVVRAQPGGEPVVANVDVEEIVGDEARVEEAFGGRAARALVAALAKATEALCAIEDVALEDVGGGTFVRLGDRFEFLPGLVRAPSPRFDRERDDLVGKLRAKNEALAPGDREATLVGTFARAPRTWAWGASNPHLPAEVRRASAALVDALPDRDLWEVSTPVFATDEATAWALAAFVCDRSRGAGVRVDKRDDGLVFYLLAGPGR